MVTRIISTLKSKKRAPTLVDIFFYKLKFMTYEHYYDHFQLIDKDLNP